MDNKKFEQLIDLIINEDEDKARALFHDIVVEKSREIYESIMDEEMMGDMDEGMGGQVGDLLDEINAEEMSEEEDPMMDMDDEEIVDIEADDTEAGEGGEEVEDAVVRIEDKLDQLMAEFEQIMGGDEEGEEDAGDMDSEEDFSDEEGDEEDMMEASDDEEQMEEEEVMEAITLKKVSVTHGDNGAYTKSPSLHDPKVKAAGVNPVKFSGASEAVPTSPKGPSNAYSKGETQVKGAGSFKNAPAQASQDLEKAPAPKKGDNGQNTKSPLGESRKIVKKRV
jgi:hypothetical protein